MNRMFVVILLLATLPTTAGCTRVKVKKVSSAHDKGIRYYRPKPYLFITASQSSGGGDKPTFSIEQNKAIELQLKTPAEVKPASHLEFGQQSGNITAPPVNPGALQPEKKKDSPETIKATADTAEDVSNAISISMSLQYLPDFAEEYAIDFRPGLGSGELNVALENGWNLTSIGVKTDQQTDEIIGSVAQLLGAIPKSAVAGKTALDQSTNTTGQEIWASNVPFGFYEAVIACDPHGRKQLYGWRYIGFMPFQSCPIQPHGSEETCCQSDAIYGLVFINGRLQFKPIGLIPREPVTIDGRRVDY